MRSSALCGGANGEPVPLSAASLAWMTVGLSPALIRAAA
jgi:hypothetical protein